VAPVLRSPASTGDTVVLAARLNMLRRFLRWASLAATCTTTSGLSSPAVSRIGWCAGVHFLLLGTPTRAHPPPAPAPVRQLACKPCGEKTRIQSIWKIQRRRQSGLGDCDGTELGAHIAIGANVGVDAFLACRLVAFALENLGL
jgi:hypothetical protein